ncbi:MAG: hypothetical protein QXP70_01880 [Methanomassiliicoccales archaeon]
MRLKTVLIISLLFLISLACVPAKGSVQVTDITPTFYSVQIYVSHGFVFVKGVVFDYNSWHSIKTVTVSAYGGNNEVVERVIFFQNASSEGSVYGVQYFKQVVGNSFFVPYSDAYASSNSSALGDITNLTVVFAFTHIDANVINMSVKDIYGKTAYTDVQIEGGYIGAGISFSLVFALAAAIAGAAISMFLRVRKAGREAGYAFEQERRRAKE